MVQEEKQLLLIDLCARLPYNPIIHIHDILVDDYDNYLCEDYLAKIRVHQITAKPYLRPMSSMTEEEREIFCERWMPDGYNVDTFDWLNAHHFDYRNLIEKGLAIEAPEGMYKH